MSERVTEHARALGQLGAAKGGKARAERLTPEERSDIARKAVQARWAKAGRLAQQGEDALLQATHGSPDHPLRIGDIEIPCFVLEDGTRVVTQRGLQTGIGMSTSGGIGGPNRI